VWTCSLTIGHLLAPFRNRDLLVTRWMARGGWTWETIRERQTRTEGTVTVLLGFARQDETEMSGIDDSEADAKD